jgi:hypothetical protein
MIYAQRFLHTTKISAIVHMQSDWVAKTVRWHAWKVLD